MNIQGYSALHLACDRGHEQIVDALLRAGADPKILVKAT